MPPAPYLKVWIRHYSFIIKCCILWVMNFAPWWRLLYPAERWGNFTINLLWIFLLICCLFKIYKNLNGLLRQQVDQYVRLFNLKEFNTSNEHFWHEKVKTTNKEIIQAVLKNMSQFRWSCQSLVDLFLLHELPSVNSKAKYKETFYCSKKVGEVPWWWKLTLHLLSIPLFLACNH